MLLALAQPSLAANTRLSVDTPSNGATLHGPLVLTGTATPNAIVEVRGSVSGTTQAAPNGRWSIALDPQNYVDRDIHLNVRSRGPWGSSNVTYLSYSVADDYNNYAYNDAYYYNRTVQDSLTDPYYNYQSPYNTYSYDPYYPGYNYNYNQNYYVTGPSVAPGERLLLSVNSPTNGSSMRGDFVLSGTGTPGAMVVVTGSLNGTTYVNSTGQWRMPLSLRGMSSGTVVNLTAFARDQYGNQSAATQLKYAVSY